MWLYVSAACARLLPAQKSALQLLRGSKRSGAEDAAARQGLGDAVVHAVVHGVAVGLCDGQQDLQVDSLALGEGGLDLGEQLQAGGQAGRGAGRQAGRGAGGRGAAS